MWVPLLGLVLPALLASTLLATLEGSRAVGRSRGAAEILARVQEVEREGILIRNLSGEAQLQAAVKAAAQARHYPILARVFQAEARLVVAQNTAYLDRLSAQNPRDPTWPRLRAALTASRAGAHRVRTPALVERAYQPLVSELTGRMSRSYVEMETSAVWAGASAGVVEQTSYLQAIQKLQDDERTLGWALLETVTAHGTRHARFAGSLDAAAATVTNDVTQMRAMPVGAEFAGAFGSLTTTATDLVGLANAISSAPEGKALGLSTLLQQAAAAPRSIAENAHANTIILDAIDRSTAHLRSGNRRALILTLVAVVLLVAFTGVATMRVYRRLRRPLVRIADQARRITDGVLEPITESGITEVVELSESLNGAVHNLAQLRDQANALAENDLSHPSLLRPAPGRLGEVFHRSVLRVVALQQQLHHDANHDPLTGLMNRRAGVAHLEGLLATGDATTGVLFIDLDGFKQVNDSLGHGAGDEVLRRVAARVQAVLPHDAVACRLGGDEFMVVAWNVDEDRLHTLGGAVLRAVESSQTTEGEPVRALSASIGVVMAEPGAGVDARALMAQADEAAYRAKASGKGRVAGGRMGS
ncbi:MAG: sensor domain-containing diguanylate cyclase [Thermoleophilia bacterium]